MSPLPRPILRLAFIEAGAVGALGFLAPRCRVIVAFDATFVRHASLVNLVPALAWWLAAAITGWLVLSTIACVAAYTRPRWFRLRNIDRLGAGVVARYVDAAFAFALGVGTIAVTTGGAAAAPAVATGPPQSTASTTLSASGPPVTVEVQPDGTLVVVPSEPSPPTTTSTTTSTTLAPAPPGPSAALAPPVPSPSPAVSPAPTPGPTRGEYVTVVAGDNLWRIASVQLSARRGRPVRDDEIVPYWRAVVSANRATLRSHDPNVIFPGELVTLPVVPAAE
jgi:hypothetical protein